MEMQQKPSVVTESLTTVETGKEKPTKTEVYITIHGHFYQPPRENPYVETIERQPSAAPFHDWNERIHHQCYRPNVFARVLNEKGEIIDIVNNFEYLSFNVGPTLMSWLERYDWEVYQKIIEADRASCERLNGHGNAIAQPYNHLILPLANPRDRITQIRWGIADFQARFGREPEGMWLPETAVDYPTLEALIAENIRFIILSPSQAQRCRPLPSTEHPTPQLWQEVGGSQINPTRPYRCYVSERDSIDIFFYDGPISADIGFHDVLSTSQYLADRLRQAIQGDSCRWQLINVATDGETFGHHKPGTEKCLAYAFTQEFPARGWHITNYGHYLSENPPTWEVMLKPVSSWSCSHGVERWRSHCGCGGTSNSQQLWRKPLRESLDWLRNQLARLFDCEGKQLFWDPWLARNDYINLRCVGWAAPNPSAVTTFLTRHARSRLSSQQQIKALKLLEMQRNSLLMDTSCGWFFEELSRPEGVQILRYASRAIALAADMGQCLETPFMDRLAQAPSNSQRFHHGADIYQELVKPAQISIEQIAAHYAFSSLFDHNPKSDQDYAYEIIQQQYQRRTIGALNLAMGQVTMQSQLTGEAHDLVFAVLHLGGWDFHCCIQPFMGHEIYHQQAEQIFATFKGGSAAKTILSMTEHFGEPSWGLENVFVENRQALIHQLAQQTNTRLHELYTQIYRDNYRILVAFVQDDLSIPRELKVAAEITLSQRCFHYLQALEQLEEDVSARENQLQALNALIDDANRLHLALEIPEGQTILQRLTLRALWHLLYECPDDPIMEAYTKRLIHLGQLLDVEMLLDRCQELYYTWLKTDCRDNQWHELRSLLELGIALGVDVRPWLQQLAS